MAFTLYDMHRRGHCPTEPFAFNARLELMNRIGRERSAAWGAAPGPPHMAPQIGFQLFSQDLREFEERS